MVEGGESTIASSSGRWPLNRAVPKPGKIGESQVAAVVKLQQSLECYVGRLELGLQKAMMSGVDVGSHGQFW